jgi:dolichol-phosphate mannosyltransferase
MIEGLRVAVVVPSYKVEAQVAGVLARMPDCIDQIVVVDDASPDRTTEVVSGLEMNRVTLVSHERNEGVGGAMITGFGVALAAGADIIVKCDGDGQMDPRDIPMLVRPLIERRAEYAKACRFHHPTELRAMPWVRLFGNIGLTLLTKLASGYWHLLDPQNGLIAIRSECLSLLNYRRLARDYFFENDMLIRLNAVAARAIDVPLPARYGDETSSLAPWRSLLTFPPRLLAGLLRRVFWRYVFYDVSPVALFLALGLLSTAFGALFGGYHWFVNAQRGEATPVGTIIIATITIILGVQFLLQAILLDVQSSPRPGPPRDPSGRSTQ